MHATILKDGTLLTFDESTQAIKVLHRASVLIIDDRVSAIAEKFHNLDTPADAEIINVEGKIVSPGFVNTHVHMWQSVYRSLGPDIVLAQYFDWLSQMSANVTNTFTPNDVYISCLQGYLEGLNAGVTTYLEHAHNNWSRDVVEPGLQAAIDSGARVWWCYDVAPKEDFATEEQWQLLGQLAYKVTQSQVKLGLSLDGLAGSYLNGSETELAHLRDMITQLNLGALTMHHMGGPWPQGNTAPNLFCARGLHNLGIPIVFSHAPYLTDEDMHALRQHDLFISITPESECHYGHGQTTGHLITDQASLGVDTNWTFSGDMISQSRLWLQSVRSRNYQKTLDSGILPNKNPMAVEQAFLLATRQGGRALRRPDIGVLQVGAKADLVVFNGDSPNMLGWRDPVAAVMLHANPGDIEHVFVNGQFRKRYFQLVNTKLDWSEIRARFLEASRRIQPQVETPTPLPDKLWGIAEMGDVDIVSTIRQI